MKKLLLLGILLSFSAAGVAEAKHKGKKHHGKKSAHATAKTHEEGGEQATKMETDTAAKPMGTDGAAE